MGCGVVIMKYILILCFLFFLSIQNVSATTTVEEIVLPDDIVFAGDSLILVGAGVREKFFMDLYVGSLYSQKRQSDPIVLLTGDGSALIRLDIISSMITSEKMEDATREGFEMATGGNTAPISDTIEDFITVFKEEIKVGDVFVFAADGATVNVLKNGQKLLTVENPQFRAALLGIWLGDDPVDEDLKEALMGIE